jgi:hypothetical protein
MFEADLSRNLHKLRSRLASGSYFPPPVKQVEIPKRQGGVRILGVPALSAAATQRMYRTIREWHLPRQTSASLNELAMQYDATLRGWLNYYARFYRSALSRVFDHVDQSLLRRAQRKYRKLARSPRRSRRWLLKMVNRQPRLFIHWLTFGKVTVRTMGAV